MTPTASPAAPLAVERASDAATDDPVTTDQPVATDQPAPPAPPGPTRLIALVEAAAAGEAGPDELRVLEANPDLWRSTLEDLLDETDEHLLAVQQLAGPERDQVLADFQEERHRLATALTRFTGPATPDGDALVLEPPGVVRLHASWSAGSLVVWASGPGAVPATSDGVSDLLEATGAPKHGWEPHSAVPLPGGLRATSLAIPVGDALGWLVALGAGDAVDALPDGGDALPDGGDAPPDPASPPSAALPDPVGNSLRWFGRVATWAVELVIQGAVVPVVRTRRLPRNQPENAGLSEASVHWAPALVDPDRLDLMASALPGPAAALDRTEARTLTQTVLGTVVDAIAGDAARRLELPAPPPAPRTTAAIAESVLTRLDGSPFESPTRLVSEVANALDRWSQTVRTPTDARLVVQLDPPDDGNAWYLSVLGRDPDGVLVELEVALVDSTARKQVAEELGRLERLLPVLHRPGGARRGQVYLSQDEAWELMTVTGPALRAAGFDVRVPPLSRRRPSPGLRLFTEPAGESVVGAHQLSNVRWSAVFDDVELTASEIARLAAEARPLVRSRGRWVELDRADLAEAAAALAERGDRTELTGAEVLRFAIGLEGSPLAGGLSVEGSGWAAELLSRADAVSTEPVLRPDGFEGELRHYQGEALAWLGFLDSVELGGCLALDMGLGKTPTVLAHLARANDADPTLVIAPPAVVGNWAAEAARFTPGLAVVVHHGASRASAEELASEVEGADIVITTYGTAVRDVEALADQRWGRLVLDEAQAIKNPANETAQQLRRIPARMRLALTGTPIENGLGDLWAILDFTNPGLVGARPAFIAQLSAESDVPRGRDAGHHTEAGSAPTPPARKGESALRALNGILVFRRTKSEPSVAAELPERIDELDHCTMTPEQIGLYQAVLDGLVTSVSDDAGGEAKKGAILAAITALKQICNHPAAYEDDGRPLAGRSGKLTRLEEIVDAVFAAGERVLVFTHFAEWGKRLADHLTEHTGIPVSCYHGGLARGVRDRMVEEFQAGEGPGALVLSLKAGGTGLNLTAASHVVLYDRWWNPAVEDQARDRAWRIGQNRTVVSHRLVCPGTVDERVEEVVAGKRHIAELVLPKSSSAADLDRDQLRVALGLRTDSLLTDDAPLEAGDPDAGLDDPSHQTSEDAA